MQKEISMNKIISRLMILMAAALIFCQVLQVESEACNIAVVSGNVSATGRPFIWKNRDHANSYKHEVKYYPEVIAGIGGSVRLMGETQYGLGVSVCTGGANESGFAITNTTCVDTDNDPLDAANVNTELMDKALESCKTLEDFEALAGRFTSLWSNKNVSGIFAVIDAYGGAAIYEMWTDGNGRPIMYRKFNVDTGVVTDQNGNLFTNLRYTPTTGFNNRTNSNHTEGWIEIWTDDPRELRARQLLSGMKDQGALSPRNIMRVLSKDVLGGDTTTYCTTANVQGNWDWSVDSWDNPNHDGELYTRYAISRYQTSMGLVIEGAATADQAKLTTMWVALGEPSLSIFVPYFPYANTVSKYATDDSHTNSGYYWDGVSVSTNKEPNSFLNLLFDCVQSNPFSSSRYPELNNIYKNISLYDNNGSGLGSGSYDAQSTRYTGSFAQVLGDYMDNTINYPRLVSLQAWTFPLEDIVIRNTNLLMAVLRDNPELVTRELLAEFSEYCNSFVYKNYSNQSASYIAWNYELPEAVDDAVDDEDIPGDYNDPGNEDPYYGDDDYDGEGDYSDPGSLVKTNPSAGGGGCGMTAFASRGHSGPADMMAGFVSLIITMLFPLGLIMMRRTYRKRRN